jgi:hypothetical protein
MSTVKADKMNKVVIALAALVAHIKTHPNGIKLNETTTTQGRVMKTPNLQKMPKPTCP